MPDTFPYFLAKSPFRFTLDTPTPQHPADLAEGAPCRQVVLGRCLVFIPMDPFTIFNLLHDYPYDRYYRYHECCSSDGCDSHVSLIFAAEIAGESALRSELHIASSP